MSVPIWRERQRAEQRAAKEKGVHEEAAKEEVPLSFIESPFPTRVQHEAYLKAEPAEQKRMLLQQQYPDLPRPQQQPAKLAKAENNFDGAVLPGRPQEGRHLDGAHAMALAVATSAEPVEPRTKCDVLLFISSAAGYERRRTTVRRTYLSLLAARPELASRVRYRFLLGAPKPEQIAVLAAEQAEHGDLLQVDVPESYETLFPKVVAAWRWAAATHDFQVRSSSFFGWGGSNLPLLPSGPGCC